MFGLLGFEAFDLIAEILANRAVIKKPTAFDIYTGTEADFDIYSGSGGVTKPSFKQEHAPPCATQVKYAGPLLITIVFLEK